MNQLSNKTLREKQLEDDVQELRFQLQEAQDVLDAIRTGEVDALAVHGPNGSQIFTLQGADHSYRILIEEMNEGAVTLNDQAIVVYSNACFARFINMPLEKVIGASFYDFVPEEYHAHFNYLFTEGWAGNNKGEILLKNTNNRLIPFSIAMNAFDIDDLPALGLIITDLSAEKEIQKIKNKVDIQYKIIHRKNDELRREKAEKESLELFRLLLESIPQISWTNLPSGEVTFYNELWYNYTGLTYEQTKDLGWKGAVHPDDMQQTKETYLNSLQNGDIFEMENRYRRGSDGSYRWHLNRAVPIRDEKGEITLWIGTATDIHDHKLALENIGSKNEELVRINDLLDTFVFAAAHDLKSPVINIQTLLSFISNTEDLQKKNELLQIVKTSVNRLDETINGLVDVIEIQSNTQSDEKINFERILDHIKQECKPELEKINGKIISDFSKAPSVFYMESYLLSIMRNLISNSIKYHSNERELVIKIETEIVDGFTLLKVQDNGIGLDMNRLKTQLFKPFTRFTKSATGKGIGLYLIKTMVERNHGKIEVQSAPNEGSTFDVFLKEYGEKNDRISE